jgi:excisionase family DNA binding protein
VIIEVFLTTKEVAERLGATVGRIQQIIAERILPAIKSGK